MIAKEYIPIYVALIVLALIIKDKIILNLKINYALYCIFECDD